MPNASQEDRFHAQVGEAKWQINYRVTPTWIGTYDSQDPGKVSWLSES